MREKINNYTLTRPRTKKVIGWFLVVIGFLALIAPVVPGAPLFFLGLEVLGLRLILTDKVKRLFWKPKEATVAVTTEAADMETQKSAG